MAVWVYSDSGDKSLIEASSLQNALKSGYSLTPKKTKKPATKAKKKRVKKSS